MKPKNFTEAKSAALEKLAKAEAGFSETEPGFEFDKISPEIEGYFFAIQRDIEAQGDMDYHLYARRIWEEIMGKDPEKSKYFADFENRMIAGLHKINMRELVYPKVTESLNELIRLYGNSAEKVVIWSTGDVSATAYQLGKISRSRIIENYYKALIKEQGREEARQTMEQKTAYMVDDDKLRRVAEYVNQIPEGQHIKLVVIEDRPDNISKFQKLFSGKNIEVIPIWAMYSRAGQNLKAKVAEGAKDQSELDALQEELNGIESFEELTNTERFGKVFENAHVFVDFDGVIGDNVKMRTEQAKRIFSALATAANRETNLAPEEAEDFCLQKIRKLTPTTNSPTF